MASSIIDSLTIPDETKEFLHKYLMQIQKDWDQGLDAIILYGSVARGDFVMGRSNINMLFLVETVTMDCLQQSAKKHRRWEKHNIVAPLLLSREGLQESSSIFPLEYLQLQDHHVVLSGTDPFGNIPIDVTQLKWQCQQEILGNLVRIRQRFVEGYGRQEAIQALLLLSITGMIACCRGILTVLGQSAKGTDSHILESLPKILQVDVSVLVQVLHMKRGLASPGAFQWIDLFERYQHNLEALWQRAQARFKEL